MPAKRKSPPVPPPATSPDRTTEYALGVTEGRIVAGPHVRDQCARHLKDLRKGKKRGLVWDVVAAEKAIDFFPDVLRLNGGLFEGEPFDLRDWQCFIIGSIFGWKRKNGLRRFTVAYIETAKGSGKSPLAAGVGIKGLVGDGESRAEIYSTATKKEQAAILFRDAVAMVLQSPELLQRCLVSGPAGKEYNIAYNKSNSFFRPMSADKKKSGLRPHYSLVDELHEHQDASAIEMMAAGFKSRSQPLNFAITNAGSGKENVCWQYHEYGVKVASGMLEDDTFFAYICAMDEKDDPFNDEACWIKANPSLPELPGMDYLRGQVKSARGMPSKEALVKRLNFCMWTEAENPLISPHIWHAAAREYTLADMKGRRCFGGLDLSSTTDLTSFVLIFEPREGTDEPWALFPFFWVPEEGLQERVERDRVPYDVWRDAGFLETTPGKAISKLAVGKRIAAITEPFDLVSINYDRWRVEDFIVMLEDEGLTLPLAKFGQGFESMSPALDELEVRLLNERLVHPGHPILTWNAANTVAETSPVGERKPSKRKSIARIDGFVASVMAVGATRGLESTTHSNPFADLNQ
jgi:phage terminase large subunit-like protein